MRRTWRLTMLTGASVLLLASSAQALTWTPDSLSFGKKKVGKQSASKTVNLSGGGCGPDTGPPPMPGPCYPDPLDIAISGRFVITANTCPPILAGSGAQGSATCAISVAFKPKAIGKREGFLRLTSTPSIQGVPLSGKGCRKPDGGKLKCKKD